VRLAVPGLPANKFRENVRTLAEQSLDRKAVGPVVASTAS
jgi:hypothetical protein